MLKEFKDFAVKGNVIDMAVGIIIGAAFGKIVSSLVKDVIMPPIGKAIGGVPFDQLKHVLTEASAATTDAAGNEIAAIAEVAIKYGAFFQTIVDFIIIAFVIFLMVKAVNNAKKKEEAKPAAPPAPSKQEVLLGEIRDLLKK